MKETSVFCSLSWFSVQCTCQTVALYFFCLLHKSAFTACHSVFFWISRNSDFASTPKNHCHKTFPSSITSGKETRTESSRFSYSLITLIVICYNAVHHKPFWKKKRQKVLTTASWRSVRTWYSGCWKGRTNQQLKFLCITVWAELHAAVLLLPIGSPMWKVMYYSTATKGHFWKNLKLFFTVNWNAIVIFTELMTGPAAASSLVHNLKL